MGIEQCHYFLQQTAAVPHIGVCTFLQPSVNLQQVSLVSSIGLYGPHFNSITGGIQLSGPRDRKIPHHMNLTILDIGFRDHNTAH